MFIRGSRIRFIIVPEMLKNAPMFKRIDPKHRVRCYMTRLKSSGLEFVGEKYCNGSGRSWPCCSSASEFKSDAPLISSNFFVWTSEWSSDDVTWVKMRDDCSKTTRVFPRRLSIRFDRKYSFDVFKHRFRPFPSLCVLRATRTSR